MHFYNHHSNFLTTFRVASDSKIAACMLVAWLSRYLEEQYWLYANCSEAKKHLYTLRNLSYWCTTGAKGIYFLLHLATSCYILVSVSLYLTIKDYLWLSLANSRYLWPESSKRPNHPRIQIEGLSTFLILVRAISNMRCIIS